MNRRKNISSGGFTLIELLVVVSIILILMGFLVPKFSGYQSKAKNTKAINTGKQIQTAAMASYGENDGEFSEQDVGDSVKQLTSAENPKVSCDEGGSKQISVTYTSDKKEYRVDVDADKNSYTVSEVDNSGNESRIFPK